MTNYYVYYRIEPGTRAQLAGVIAELFAAVARATGIHGRWMQRRDDPDTCMEVYEQVRDAAGFEALLAREAQLRDFARYLARDSARYTECFVDAGDHPCA